MVFNYKAIDSTGAMVKGTYEADEQQQVVAYIRSLKMQPVQVSMGREALSNITLFNTKPKSKDMSMFCEQFCSLLRAGVTIIETLKMLIDQTKNNVLKAAIQETIVGIKSGESLGVAMSRSPKAFAETLVSLVKAGEASGSLDTSLERMAAQYKKDAELEAAIKKALVYPIVVVLVAIGVAIFMLVVIIPKFNDIFDTIGIELPKLTVAVVAASHWIQRKWYICLIVIAVIVVAFVVFKQSAQGKKFFSFLALNVPVVKALTVKSYASKIARTMSTLLSAGMPLIEAISIIGDTCKNYYFKEAFKAVKEDVLIGRPMSQKMLDFPNLFPQMLVHMIAVGEDTGDMTEMLVKTSDYYDLEVETTTSTLMTLMQPAIILLLAAMVSVLVAAVIAPMIKMYAQLGDAL